MPYKFDTDKMKLPAKIGVDRRIKLTEDQKDEIRMLWKSGEHSQRGLARMYGVNKRLISFILFPEKQQANLDRRKERGGWKLYYDKEKHAESVRSHRRHKQEIAKKGL